MVFFTCNHCGESVKKPAVEKHYNFKCRGVPKNVSCMDCQKDFHGEDYVAHTRCISEAEKYSGKDYVAKEPKNSGQKKQEGWMDIIRSILDTKEYNLSAQARATFQKLQTVDNVPRKKVKFQNFVANCMRMRTDHAEEIWKILEKELEKMKAAKAIQSSANGEAKVTENHEIDKKNERSEENKNNDNNDKNENDEQKSEEKPEEKSEQKTEENPESISTDQPEKKRVKKSHSKKRKVDKQIQNTIEQDEEKDILEMVTEIVALSSEPSKKKKKKKSDESKKAKKQKTSADQEPTISTTTREAFQWALVMLYTIRKYGDSMKLDKLKRKVQRMYLSKREMTAFTEKQQSRFDKKFVRYLKKCHLKVENDVVSVGPKKASSQ